MFRRNVSSLAAYGFIGLGQMGARMAPNMFDNADVTELHVYDVNPEAAKSVIEAAAGKTVKVCASPAEVAKGCKKIITMLPNPTIVKDVYAGMMNDLQEGSVMIDCSTIDTQTPKDVAAELTKKNIAFFDAPVSGGVNAAAGGTLTFMVGSPNEGAFPQAEAVLATMAKSVVDCGMTGAGQACKLCNNLILGQHMVAVSEAMLMGTRLGVDPKTLASIFNTSTGRCWSSDTYNPYPGILPNVPSSNDYAGGFGSSLMLKDLRLAIDAAKGCHLETTGAKNAEKLYSEMCEGDAKMGELDFSGVLKYIDEHMK